MKKLGIAFTILVVLAFAIPPFLPTSVGHALYAKGTVFEASLFGLSLNQADIGEMQITYYANEIDAEKPSVIMIHGYSADKNAWPRYAQHFVEDYHVIIPDMAGHGDTGFDPAWSYSAPAQAERILKLMDKLGIEKAHILGNSMGGFISAHFALRYPDRTLSATLIDPAGVKSPQPSNMELMLKEGKNPFEIYSKEDFDKFFAMTMAKPPWFPEIVLAAVAEKYQDKRAELMRIHRDFYGNDMLDDSLKDINVPVLLLWGDEDELIHVSSVDVWKAGIPNIETKIWPGIGHMPMMEVPKESADVTMAFFAANQ